ncbi:hypothetical protein ACJJTC_000006 [Scirpophaga incertulas]
MDLSRIYFHALLKDELIYEVFIRAETPEETVVKLIKQLKKLSTDFLPEEIITADLTISEELPLIKDKLSVLEDKLNDFLASGSRSSLSRARALFCHLYFRIDRVEAELEEHIKGKSEVKNRLLSFKKKLTNVSREGNDLPPFESLGSDDLQNDSFRKHHDINKWGVKFNGLGNPHSFLERVEELASAYNVTHDKLFCSAVCLFVDAVPNIHLVSVWFRSRIAPPLHGSRKRRVMSLGMHIFICAVGTGHGGSDHEV